MMSGFNTFQYRLSSGLEAFLRGKRLEGHVQEEGHAISFHSP
jgi:hypothetical protein